MTHLDLIWSKTTNIFPILNKTLIITDSDNSDCTTDDFNDIVIGLCELDIAEQVYESILIEIEYKLRQEIVPNFWKHFKLQDQPQDQPHAGEKEIIDQERGFYQFQVAVYELYKNYGRIMHSLGRLKQFKQMCQFKNVLNLNRDEFKWFNEIVRVSLLSKLPVKFNLIVYSFYTISFKVFVSSHHENDISSSAGNGGSGGGGGGGSGSGVCMSGVASSSSSSGGCIVNTDEDMLDLDNPENEKCKGCNKNLNVCRCQDLVAAFNKTNSYLAHMNLLDRLAGFTLTKLIQERICAYVQDTFKGIFDQSHINNLEKWLDTIVLNWLTRIYDNGTGGNKNVDDISDTTATTPTNSQSSQNVVKDFKVKLSYYLYETYANTIIEQFFNIIIDYPDSQPAIDDLKICLKKLDLRQHLVKSLKQALETRLLHPGVNTNDILTGYVAAIKAIRHLDSSGALLETITEPVKQYMRGRIDAVRCVVTALTEDGPADLAEELAKSEVMAQDPTNSNDEMTNWETWKPDPVDVNPKKENNTTRSADIISMVVDIYGSKEMFVGEYRNLLADRLLAQLDFCPEKEIRNLELLKLRFGDSILHTCEVMLKDISDSKRIDAHIHSDPEYDLEKQSFKISSLILSSQFWPTFKNETLELPEKLQNEFDKYTKSYEAYKGNRTLLWRPAIGRVNIEIELSNRTLELAVTPPQAAIIYLFQDKSEWTLDELCKEIKVPPTLLRKRISLWQSHGVIKEPKTDVFVLVENANGQEIDEMMQQTQTQHDLLEDDETESAMASASDQREEELQVFWSYIVGMLTNLDSLPLERIHQMLKMFASHGPGVEFSQEELKNFLQRKVREHELIFAGGVYHLPK